MHYNPFVAVINNIEYDHADIFEIYTILLERLAI